MKAKRLGNGRYLYRGYVIQRYDNEGFIPGYKFVWEAVDENGCGFAHSGLLSITKALIDDELKNERYE